MVGDEYEALRARIEAQLADAIRASDEVRDATAGQQGVGRSEDGIARVTIDHQGFFTDVQFAGAMAELDSEELREAFLAALAGARADLQGTAPVPPAPVDLNDTSTIDALDALLRGDTPRTEYR